MSEHYPEPNNEATARRRMGIGGFCLALTGVSLAAAIKESDAIYIVPAVGFGIVGFREMTGILRDHLDQVARQTHAEEAKKPYQRGVDYHD